MSAPVIVHRAHNLHLNGMLLRLMCQWPGLKGGILRLKRKVAYTGLIETAKLNGLDPYRYLLHVLMTAPGIDAYEEPVEDI